MGEDNHDFPWVLALPTLLVGVAMGVSLSILAAAVRRLLRSVWRVLSPTHRS